MPGFLTPRNVHRSTSVSAASTRFSVMVSVARPPDMKAMRVARLATALAGKVPNRGGVNGQVPDPLQQAATVRQLARHRDMPVAEFQTGGRDQSTTDFPSLKAY